MPGMDTEQLATKRLPFLTSYKEARLDKIQVAGTSQHIFSQIIPKAEYISAVP